jgi:hypothetical protein
MIVEWNASPLSCLEALQLYTMHTDRSGNVFSPDTAEKKAMAVLLKGAPSSANLYPVGYTGDFPEQLAEASDQTITVDTHTQVATLVDKIYADDMHEGKEALKAVNELAQRGLETAAMSRLLNAYNSLDPKDITKLATLRAYYADKVGRKDLFTIVGKKMS